MTPLLDDEEITEVMVNGKDQIFFERNGEIKHYELRFDNDEN